MQREGHSSRLMRTERSSKPRLQTGLVAVSPPCTGAAEPQHPPEQQHRQPVQCWQQGRCTASHPQMVSLYMVSLWTCLDPSMLTNMLIGVGERCACRTAGLHALQGAVRSILEPALKCPPGVGEADTVHKHRVAARRLTNAQDEEEPQHSAEGARQALHAAPEPADKAPHAAPPVKIAALFAPVAATTTSPATAPAPAAGTAARAAAVVSRQHVRFVLEHVLQHPPRFLLIAARNSVVMPRRLKGCLAFHALPSTEKTDDDTHLVARRRVKHSRTSFLLVRLKGLKRKPPPLLLLPLLPPLLLLSCEEGDGVDAAAEITVGTQRRLHWLQSCLVGGRRNWLLLKVSRFAWGSGMGSAM